MESHLFSDTCKSRPLLLFYFMSSCIPHLQRELWSLCGSLQGLLAVVGLQHRSVPLLRIPVRRHKVIEALWMIEAIKICSAVSP